jgi:hypothetical protein
VTEQPLVEPAPEPPAPRLYYPPVEPAGEVARKNLVLGVGLFALFLLIFGATFLVAYVYLHYS